MIECALLVFRMPMIRALYIIAIAHCRNGERDTAVVYVAAAAQRH
jgi:hypothetical protein